MRLLMVCGPTAYGAATCVRQLTHAAVKGGFRTTVACPADGPLRDWVLDEGGDWVELPLSREVSWRDVGCFSSLRQMMRQADVVHLHSSKAGALGRAAATTLRPRPAVLFSPHGWSWHVGGPLALLYRGIEWALAPIGATVCVSEDEASLARRVLGRRAQPCAIDNAVDTRRFTPEGSRASRTEDPLLVVVGRFCPAKGQDVAVRVLAGLGDRRLRLRFVGGGDELETRQLAERLGVAAQVDWAGQTDPAPHYRAADIVLVPSRYDGLSLAMLEAMASGCAVVATETPGTGALADAGVVVPPGDLPGLIKATAALLDEPIRRQRLGEAARARAVMAYDLARYDLAWQEAWRAAARGATVRDRAVSDHAGRLPA